MGTDTHRPGYWAEYRATHRKELRVYGRKYRAKNRERCRTQARDCYYRNYERRLAANQAWRDANIEFARARNAAFYRAKRRGLKLCRNRDCYNMFPPNDRGRPQLYCSRACKPRDRRDEYQHRRLPELTPLFPDLAYGNRWSFWVDELAMDLRQEHSLAELEGRNPGEAVRVYRAREYAWKRITVPLVERGLGAGVPSQANWVNI